MDEENELEEGEAWSGREDDSCIDPDAFSYIVRPLNASRYLQFVLIREFLEFSWLVCFRVYAIHGT